ncbi:COG1470 family protein [Microaerobacter geothermalis]|uniref:COG1470 family protein n=1 Tax=Microaerobacter geothermalis TaxID=674972 RepID=UPI002E35AD12|nr:NEW3 domain-containing protein [Microaerobacter geothermalis]
MNRPRKKQLNILLTLLLGVVLLAPTTADAAEPLVLYTPYTDISVTPGESINYSIDVINHSNAIQKVKLSVEGAPDDWEYQLTSGGWSIREIAVLPNASRTVSLEVDVPLEVNKGAYRFYVTAEGKTSLPITINVTEQGTYKTELTTDQPNMEGKADSTFTFEAALKNRTADKQLYALTSDAPRGWDVQFKVDYKNVTSVSVEANSSKDIDIEITPPEKIKEGIYKIPVKAAAGSTSAVTELEVVITGSYDLELSTPTGLLSTDVTAGDEKKLEIKVTNKGTADLRDIKMDADTPINWEVDFEPKTINKLEAGKSVEVMATIKADKKAIAGDYVVNMSASAPEASSDAQFRVAVKTSLLWGWLGILIILLVIGGVYYLFRTYGRR